MGLVIVPAYPDPDTVAPVAIPDDAIEALAYDRWDLAYGEVDLAPSAVQAAASVAGARGMAPHLVDAILTFAAAVERTGYGINLWRSHPEAPWTLRMSAAPHQAPEVSCTASTAYAVFAELGLPYDAEQACGRADARTVLTRCQEAQPDSSRRMWIDQLQRVAEYALRHGIREIAWA